MPKVGGVARGNPCFESFHAGIGHSDHAAPLVTGNKCSGNVRARFGSMENGLNRFKSGLIGGTVAPPRTHPSTRHPGCERSGIVIATFPPGPGLPAELRGADHGRVLEQPPRSQVRCLAKNALVLAHISGDSTCPVPA